MYTGSLRSVWIRSIVNILKVKMQHLKRLKINQYLIISSSHVDSNICIIMHMRHAVRKPFILYVNLSDYTVVLADADQPALPCSLIGKMFAYH